MLYQLHTCVWEITLACCFSCNYCGSRAGKARENELTTEECLEVAQQLADMGCYRVSLICGEVFMKSDWKIILKALTDRDIKVSIITNSGMAVYLGCQAGLTNIGIDSVGNVRGCESMYDESFIEGNLREKSLYEIWNDPDAFSYNRKFTMNQLTGKCKDCEYGCKCAGGCRSYNYFTHGKMYDSLFCAR